MKRKLDVLMTLSKRNVDYTIDKSWVSATQTRNYLLNDPCLDWYEHHTESRLSTQLTGTQFLFQQGIIFEKEIVSHLKSLLKDNEWVDVSGTHFTATSQYAFEQTCKYIKEKVPVIFSGVLHSQEKKFYGVPDLIVKRDYLSKLIKSTPSLELPLYVIIDIKFSTLELSVKSNKLLSGGSNKAYFGQVYMYSQILEELLKEKIEYGFLLGRGWKSGNIKCTDPLDILGEIHFNNEISTKFNDAVEWIRSVRNEGHAWNGLTLPYSNDNLYPNMSALYPSKHDKFKRQIAEANKELTLLYQVGVKNRKCAHSCGIYKLDDPKLRADHLGFGKDHSYHNVINAFLDKLSGVDTSIFPESINISFPEKFIAIDIEMISNGYCYPKPHGEFTLPFIFLLGIYDGETYTNFTADELTEVNEKDILNKFFEFIHTTYPKHRLLHWGAFEHSELTRVCENYGIAFEPCDLYNLCKTFSDTPIITKDTYNFKLKEVGTALYNHKLINKTWTGDILNGKEAMDAAYNYYCMKTADCVGFPIMRKIIKYNRMDCEVLYEIAKLTQTRCL